MRRGPCKRKPKPDGYRCAQPILRGLTMALSQRAARITPKLTITATALFAGLFIGLAATSCSSDIGRFSGLEARVHEYYRYESREEWIKTYSMRTPTYRRSVPINTYIAAMKRDNDGWRFEDYQILRTKEKIGKVHVTIRFVEIAPITFVPADLRAKAFPPGTTTVRMERVEDSIWMRINNEWFCYDAVSRSHLSQNEALVFE